MEVRHIDHVQLAMPAGREDEARAFYEDVLGIPEIAKPAHLAARGGCWFERGPLKVHVGVEENFVPARKAHPAFIVEGLGETDDEPATRGIPCGWERPISLSFPWTIPSS